MAIYKLSNEDYSTIIANINNPSGITRYFFSSKANPGGFVFDKNFRAGYEWQEKVAKSPKKLISVIGGVGTGKSLLAIMSAAYYSLVLDDFKYLNVAHKLWTAKIQYDILLDWASGTIFGKMIWKSPSMPYPKIILKWIGPKGEQTATFEFMSVSDNAKTIFSWRGDFICHEEAGLNETLDETMKNLSTRMTGSTKSGRPFLGKILLISNPHDNPSLLNLHNIAAKKGMALTVPTKANRNVTREQVLEMLKFIDKDDRQRFLDGTLPEGSGSYYRSDIVKNCESEMLDHAECDVEISQELLGVVHLEMKPSPNDVYAIIGDPGTENLPSRNSPVLMCWNITDPFSVFLSAFWWGEGNKSIMPFLNKIIEWKSRYNVIYCGVDSTGNQKMFSQVANSAYNLDISGLDFGGARKYMYLNTLRVAMEQRWFFWAKKIDAIRRQVLAYNPAEETKKTPQDVVSCLAMSAFYISVHRANAARAGFIDRNAVGSDVFRNRWEAREFAYRLDEGFSRFQPENMPDIRVPR